MSNKDHSIVVLDDDSEVLDNIKDILDRNIKKCDLVCFDKADDNFWDLIKKIKVDLFIIDIHLGSKDGRDITEKIIREKRGSLFLFISGYDYTIESLSRFRGRCVYDFMAKPIVYKDFVNRIEVLLSVAKSFRLLAEEYICENNGYEHESGEFVRARYRKILEQDKIMIQSLKI